MYKITYTQIDKIWLPIYMYVHVRMYV